MAVNINGLDTPALIVDVDRAEANLKRAQDYADKNGVRLRPHIKTHKLPRFARRQVELGAIGITCQKVGEAEVMVDAGLEDIFLPYNILGPQKLFRLAALARRAKISVAADSEYTVAGYAEAFANEPQPLRVLVECDTGGGRCGVQSPEAAVALAKVIDGAKGVTFAGIMTYPAAGMIKENGAWLAEVVSQLTAAGLKPEVVSNGGTPDFWSAHEVKLATEHRPGTYIYLDRSQVARKVGTFEDCALTVLATVVSRPTGDRAVLDTGSKALTSDTLGMVGFGRIVEYPDAVIKGLSEEHGTVDLSGSSAKPKVGERVRIIPNHACPVSNLFDKAYLVSGETVVDCLPIAARGRVT